MTARRLYRFYGWTVSSELELAPDQVYPPASDSVVDLELVWGPARQVPEEAPPGVVLAQAPHREGGGRNFYTGVGGPAGFVLRVHRTCDFEVSPDLRLVVCHPDPAGGRELAGLLFCGTAMAFLLGLAGRVCLHASAVVGLGGSAIALLGAAGSGKSTTAALLCAAGASFLSDDLVVAEDCEALTKVAGGCYELRLRSKAQSVLEYFEPRPPTRQTPDGRNALLLSRSDSGAVPLGCLVLPIPDRQGAGLSIERLPAVEALFNLAGASRLGGWSHRAVLVAQFDLASRLAETVPLFAARIPWSPGPAAKDGRLLLELLPA